MLKLFYMSVKDVSDGVPSDISEYRKDKILSARRDEAKRLMTAAALVLKAGFASFGVNEKDIVYSTLENGKPFALSHPEIHFSLSHSETMAVAVFSDSPVGVDCERADREVPAELVRRFLHLPKNETVAEPLLMWVAGESISKLSGLGILSDKAKSHISVFNGHVASCGDVTLEKFTLLDNLVVISTKSYEKAEIIGVS